MKSIIAYSGGLDSTVLAYDTVDSEGADSVELAHVDLGTKTSKVAIEAMKFHAERLGVRWTVIPMQLPSVVTEGCRIFDKKGDRKKRAVDSLGDEGLAQKQDTLWDDYAPGLYTIIWIVLGALAVRRGCSRVLTGFQQHNPDGEVIVSRSDTLLDCCAYFTDYLNAERQAIWGRGAPMFLAPLNELTKEDVVALGRHHDVDMSMTHSCDIYPACGVCYECRAREAALDG